MNKVEVLKQPWKIVQEGDGDDVVNVIVGDTESQVYVGGCETIWPAHENPRQESGLAVAEHIVELHNSALVLRDVFASDKHPFEMTIKEMWMSAINAGAGQIKFTMNGKDGGVKVLALVALNEDAAAIDAYADQISALGEAANV